ncbi:protein phosphatase 2C domain-containing protein [Hyphomonas sp.]|uniref:PP2C family protein-serine/threonine phosphatase n=1 Tax=Hyphomonas sp. TaxID=87 RepID=UPI0025C134C4|nr:protein phosphatase 2C domain-containing protein [Hyphomonas sp.]
MTCDLKVCWRTHTGFARKDNQDSIWVNGHIGRDDMREPAEIRISPETALTAIVCDGIGGGPGGREASETASEAAGRTLSEAGVEPDISVVVSEAGAAMHRRSLIEPHLKGFGTTIAGVHVRSGYCTWFNLGDSRIYSLRDGFLRQLSLDHVASAGSNILTSWIGDSANRGHAAAWWGREQISPGTVYLVCSDGLFLHLSADEISEHLAEPGIGAVAEMLDLCLRRGGKDNISLVQISVHERGASHDG